MIVFSAQKGPLIARIHEFPWEYRFAPYTAHSPVQLIRIAQGHGEWFINDKLYPIGEGDILLLSALDYRQFLPLEKGVTLRLEALIIQPPRSHAEDMNMFYLRPAGFSNLLKRGNPHTEAIDQLFTQLFERVSSSESDALDVPFIEAALTLCCVHLAYTYRPDGSGGGQARNQLLRDAYHYIAAHAREEMTAASIAAALYCTPEHLSRVFHQLSGIRLTEYIRRVRIRQVIRHMERENTTVLEAAFACGFSSSSGFYKAFHAETGLTPRQYFRQSDPSS